MSRLRSVVLADLSATERRRLLRRSAVPDPEVRRVAAEICETIRLGGDQALGQAAQRYGGGRQKLAVSRAEMSEALRRAPASLMEAIENSAAAIERFHQGQLPMDRVVETNPGVEVTRTWTPLRRVGAYVPGGGAAYPSTLLMIAVPARLAGIERLVLASPAGADNELSPALLAAASWIGIEEWYVMGGAQAVAALAHGTETIEPVEKIVGPGNAWVTAAKLAVFGVCSIDLPAGPSEVLVVANGSADPALVAADLLCQAEHGEDSTAVLVTTSARLVDRVEAELERLLPRLNRREILAASLQRQGLAVIASDQTDLISFANEYAAEHVTILTEDPEEDAKAITAAGSVFVGVNAPESAGDYATGANHVLPTGGLAGACGPLSVEDFGSWRQVQRLSRMGLAGIRSTITTLADAEGLDAHRLAADIRFETASS